MKTVLVFCVIVVIATATPSTLQLKSHWVSFKQNFNKHYERPEELKRLATFKENLLKIEEHNKRYEQGLVTYKLGINKFADMTSEEFKEYLKRSSAGRQMPKSNNVFKAPEGLELPETVDWRNKGVVTPVKDQGQCGSCWTFSTTGSLEGQLALKTGKLVSLSEQELVDCVIDDFGCGGGLKNDAFVYTRDNGLTSEQQYPYEAEDNVCRRGSKPEAVRNKDHVVIQEGAESDLAAAVATVGPIGVAVDASPWHLYESGVFEDNECLQGYDELNHEVLVVGYDNDSWLVKNSWAADWGENGYIRLARNKNVCGVASDASYPVL